MSLINFTIIEPDKIELLRELYAASLELPDNNPNSLKNIISSYVLIKQANEDIYDCTIYEIAKADIDNENYDKFLAILGPYITDRMIPDENSYDLVRNKISGIINFAFNALGEEILDIKIPNPSVYKFIISAILYNHICEVYDVTEGYDEDDRIHLKIKKKN